MTFRVWKEGGEYAARGGLCSVAGFGATPQEAVRNLHDDADGFVHVLLADGPGRVGHRLWGEIPHAIGLIAELHRLGVRQH